MLGLSIEECIAASKLMTQGLKKKYICHLLVLQIWIHTTQLDLPTSSPTTYSSVARIGESDDICIFFSICSNTCHKVRERRNKKDGVTIGNSRATLYKCREMRFPFKISDLSFTINSQSMIIFVTICIFPVKIVLKISTEVLHIKLTTQLIS